MHGGRVMAKQEKKPIMISFHTDMKVCDCSTASCRKGCKGLNLKEVEATYRKMSHIPIPKDQPIQINLIYAKDEPVGKTARSTRGGADSGSEDADESG